jgi:hypothetical protein
MALARIDLNQKAVVFAAPNGGAAVIPCRMPLSWPSQMTVPGVRREKAALSSGCKPHPATAPAGSNRSSHGGNEVAEEIRMLRSTWRGLETWHGRDGVTLADERARQQGIQTSTYTGAPVLDPTDERDVETEPWWNH